MDETPKTVFVTKYALTGGISEREVIKFDADGWAYVKAPGAPPYGLGLSKKKFALTREDAAKQAAAMRDAKVKSLEKQAEKLRALIF